MSFPLQHDYMRIQAIMTVLLNHLSSTDKRYPFTKEEVGQISMLSVLHDAGKAVIPGEILNANRKLTKEEFDVVKRHPVLGIEILQKHGFLSEDLKEPPFLYDICRHHHERWDGKGYPDGLKGDEIPIVAQVIGIVDVYDALRRDRVYRSGLSHQEALDIINKDEGHFSPTVLKCFMENEKLIESISDLDIASGKDTSVLLNLLNLNYTEAFKKKELQNNKNSLADKISLAATKAAIASHKGAEQIMKENSL